MTEKELRKLNRYQLLEMLVVQTERADKLQAHLHEMEKQMNQQDLQMTSLGSIAEASLQLSGIFQAAQEAADIYVDAAKKRAEEMEQAAQKNAAAIRAEADAYVAEAKKQAEEIRQAAKAAADAMEARADACLEAAQKKAEEIRQAAKANAKTIIDDADAYAFFLKDI